MRGESLGHLPGQTPARELLRGDVHAHTEARVAAAAPVGDLTAGLVEDMAAEGEDQPGLLGEAHELTGEDEPAVRMAPPHERFHADDAARLERHDRLVVDVELLRDHGALEVGLEREPLEHMLVHRGLVDRVPALALALRPVHREVCAAHQLAGRLRPRPERDADACLHGDVRPDDRHGAPHRGEDPSRNRHGALRLVDALDQDRELVAAEPRARVLGPDARADPLGNHDQEIVSSRVAKAVVDGLEVVEVDEEHREEVASTCPTLDRMRDPLGEERAVREPGERVVEGLMRELILQGAALGHVSRGEDDAADVLVSEQVVEDAFELDDRTVLPA